MKRFFLINAAMLAGACFVLSTMGFQCSSPNVTSGKMYYQQYLQSHDQAKLDLAMESFQKETAEKPGSAEGWYWLGIIHGEKKNFLKLQEAWDKSKKAGPEMHKEIAANSPAFWGQAYNAGVKTYSKAAIRKDKAMYGEAADMFKAAILLEPDSSAKYGAYVSYAYAQINLDNLDEATASLEKQLKSGPNAEAYRILGQVYIQRANALKKDNKIEEANKRYEETLQFLTGALAKFPDNSDLNQEILNVYVASNRVVEAQSRFKEFADKNPNDKVAQYAYGTVLLEVKDYENAATYLAKAVALDAKFENAMYNYCVACLKWGIKARDEESAKNPDKQVTSHKPIIEKAVPQLQALTKLKPDAIQYWDLAGKVYASLGMTKEANEAYDKVDAIKKAN
jgi:tetratricopeptide (TPR) repeat protein